MSVLMSLRKIFIGGSEKLMTMMRDPQTGKIKFFDSPQQLKMVLMIAGVVAALSVIGYQMFQGTDPGIEGAKDFNKEVENKLGINAIEKEIPTMESNPIDNIRVGNQFNTFDNSSRNQDDGNRGPTFEICAELMNKLKAGTSLTGDETEILKECINKNILEMTPEELALAKRLLEDGILTPSEIEQLKNLFADEPECKDEFDAQMKSDEGKEFLLRMMRDNSFNAQIIEILRDKTLLERMNQSPELFKSRLGISDTEWGILQKLMEKCSANLLIKLLSDPSMRDALAKLIESGGSLLDVLTGDGLTGEEKDLIRKLLAGEIDEDSVDGQIARALLGSDPFKKQDARNLLKARTLGDKTLSEALRKRLMGEDLSPTEESLLAGLDSDKLDEAYRNRDNPALAEALLKQAKGLPLTAEEKNILDTVSDLDSSILQGNGIDKEALLQKLAEDIAAKKLELDSLLDELARAQAAAREAAAKLQAGLPLSEADQAALKKLTALQDRINQLKDLLAQRQNELGKVYTSLETTMARAGATLRQVDPEGSIMTDYSLPDCNKVKPFKLIRKVVKNSPKVRKPKGPAYVDEFGNPLSPDQIKLYELLRKESLAKESQEKLARERLLNPLLGTGVVDGSAVAAVGGEKGVGNINDLFISENANLKPFTISPSKPIAAKLINQILVSDKGQGMLARVKILQDVYDAKTNKLAIPKGTIAQGRTPGFDDETGIMNLTLDKVFVGGDQLDISFSVASADLEVGLRGEVRDTRGKLLLGTFITSFTSGALAALSQNYIAPFQDSDVLGDSLVGAGLSGGAEVAQRVAELYAGDLQNAAKVFYVPANIPVVLYAAD